MTFPFSPEESGILQADQFAAGLIEFQSLPPCWPVMVGIFRHGGLEERRKCIQIHRGEQLHTDLNEVQGETEDA